MQSTTCRTPGPRVDVGAGLGLRLGIRERDPTEPLRPIAGRQAFAAARDWNSCLRTRQTSAVYSCRNHEIIRRALLPPENMKYAKHGKPETGFVAILLLVYKVIATTCLILCTK